MIRHVWSLVAGLVAALVAFFVMSLNLEYAQVRLTGDPQGFQLSFARLVVIGLILGVVATLNISPVGSLVAGVLLLAPTTIALISQETFVQLFSDRDFTIGIVGVQPLLAAASGAGAVLGALMLVAGASPSRWRGRTAQPAFVPAPVAVPELAPIGEGDGEPVVSAAQLGQQWAPPQR